MSTFARVSFACEGTPGGPPNEDYAAATPDFAVVFDGVTLPAGMDNGCIHGTSWLVRKLAASLFAQAESHGSKPLADMLATAIETAVAAHAGCDLSHPGTPSTTIAMLRLGESEADYLVLSDNPLVLDLSGRVEVINDERLSDTSKPERAAVYEHSGELGTEAHRARVRALSTSQRPYRNVEGGYWLASTKPEAAYKAFTGAVPLTGPDRLTRAALLTDGASVAVDGYALTDWTGLLDSLRDDGPQAVIRRVREVELADPTGARFPRYKKHDDASAIFCELPA